MIDPYILAALLIFLLGFILLTRTKAKRYFIIFMIETKHGLRFVDMVARISPGLWKFLGDLAIVISFGGLGAYYVSRYRNTWLITGLIGVIFVFTAYLDMGVQFAFVFLLVLLVGIALLKKIQKPFFHLIGATIVIAALIFVNPMFGNMGFLTPYFAVLVGVFGVPALLISLLFSHSLEIIVGQSTIPGVSPLLPGVSDQGLVFYFPGTGIAIPFWQALIAIIVLLVPHEFAHGVLTRCHKIKLKSMGILTAGPIPVGAFAEPDNKEMEKHEGKERMRIYAVGSFTNLIVSILALILFVSVSTMIMPAGMMITNIDPESPAQVSLETGLVIEEINGVPTLDTPSFFGAVQDLKPGETTTFLTDKGTYQLVTAEHPDNASKGYIGIDLKVQYETRDEYRMYGVDPNSVIFGRETLFWIFFLCFNIALVNLLPIIPFDGGKMFEEMMKEFGVKKARKEKILKAVIFIILMLLIVNALPLIYLLMEMIGI